MSKIDKIERCLFGFFILLITALWAYFISIWAALIFVVVTMTVESVVKWCVKYFRDKDVDSEYGRE